MSHILDLVPDPGFGRPNGSPIFEIISQSLDSDVQILDLGAHILDLGLRFLKLFQQAWIWTSRSWIWAQILDVDPPGFRIDFKKRCFGSPNQGFEVPNHTIWYGMVWYGMVWCGMVWYGVV